MTFLPRLSFPFPTRAPSYFLGHMARSLRGLPKILEDIDLVIEARDARLPLSGINGGFEGVVGRAWGMGGRLGLGGVAGERGRGGSERIEGVGGGRMRERIVVYTKKDLAEGIYEEPLRRAFLQHANQRVFFTDTSVDKDVKHILRYAVQLAEQHKAVMNEMKILVVGMPNVGKSSLLNALRRVGVHKGKAFRVSSQPGYTRKLTGTVRIHSDPDIYVYDTPGVMVPYMGKGEKGAERGLKFALTTGIKVGLFEEELVADYLLYLLNRRHFSSPSLPSTALSGPTYLDHLNLTCGPTNSLPDLLDALARRLGTLRKGGEADTDAALGFFLKAFREGKLGRMTLDELEVEGSGRLLGDLALGQQGVEVDNGVGREFGDNEDGEWASQLNGRAGEERELVIEEIATTKTQHPLATTPANEADPATSGTARTLSDGATTETADLTAVSLTTNDATDTIPALGDAMTPVSHNSPTSPTPSSSSSSNLYAQVSSVVRTYLLDQARKLDQTEEMSLSQERKREVQMKKKDKADKWAKKNPGTAKGLVAGGFGGKTGRAGGKTYSKNKAGRGR